MNNERWNVNGGTRSAPRQYWPLHTDIEQSASDSETTGQVTFREEYLV